MAGTPTDHPPWHGEPPGPGDGEAAAAALIARVAGVPARSVRRFPTGLAHFVYDVVLEDGRAVVLRVTRPAQAAAFEAAARLLPQLAALGIPVPVVLHADPAGALHGVPVLVLERLPGRDLGLVYAELSDAQRRDVALGVVAAQEAAGRLPPGRGFGYGVRPDDPSLHPSWRAFLGAHLRRSEERLARSGVASIALVARVQQAVDAYGPDLDAVPPRCFLDDTTTKNVLVEDGRLSGIVDVDGLCWGDPLRVPALTRVSLAAQGLPEAYVEHWMAVLGAGPSERRRAALYFAIYAVEFLSELGLAWNRAAAPPRLDHVRRLLGLVDRGLREAG